MRRRFLALVLGVAFVMVPLPPATAAESPTAIGTEWLELATQAANESATAFPFVDEAGQNIQVWWISPLAWYAGRTWGWQDSRTQFWLREVYERRNADGGYGLGEPWDWRGDGTTNPATTSYTITTAWHVGRTLIDGYDGGGVPRERVVEAVASLLNTSQTSNGRCISYSNSRYDENKPCVWNINATAAWFVWRALQRGLVPAGREAEALNKLRTWRNFTRANYNRTIGGWPYESGQTVLQDPWHNAATVGPMWEADPTLTEPLPDHFAHWPNTTGANADLVIYDCALVTPTLITYARRHAFPSYDTQRERLQSRSRWAFMALRVHLTCAT